MRDVIQVCMAMLGAVGFAVWYHVRKEKLIVVTIGGALSWIVYLVVLRVCGDKALGLFISTVTVGFLAEVLARIIKTPVTILLVPMLIPLIPGSDLYYTTSYFLRKQMDDCVVSLESLMKSVGAIAFGIVCVTCLVQVISRVRSACHVREIECK